MTQHDSNEAPAWLFPVVQSFVILLLSVVIAFKVLTTPFDLVVDFPILLSLLLALFSVALAALFYFKATETSNAFYDNTYKFTRDIAELLVRIESGFGERLRHLDESYAQIHNRFLPPVSKEDSEKAQQHVKQEEENLASKLQERDKLIDELAERAKLDAKEKQRFIQQLSKQEEALRQAEREFAHVRDEAELLRRQTEHSRGENARLNTASNFIRGSVIPAIGPTTVAGASHAHLNERWLSLVDDFPRGFMRDLHDLGFLNDDRTLNTKGIKLIKTIAFRSQ